MKKILEVITISGIICMLLSSCSMRSNDSVLLTDENCNQIGTGHNQIMENAFDEIQIMKEAGTFDWTRENASDRISNFVANQLMSNEIYPEIDYAGHESINKLSSVVDNMMILMKSAGNGDMLDALADSIPAIASNRSVFDSLSIILTADMEESARLSRLQALYRYVEQSSECEEKKAPVLAAIRTSMSSYEYWDEAIDEWSALSDSSISKQTVVSLVGAIAIVDGAGAVVGAVEGIRDTHEDQDNRGWIIVGRAIGEGAKTSLYAVVIAVCPILL